MKIRALLILCVVVLLVSLMFSGNVAASVTVDGQVYFDFSAFPSTPAPYFYGWGGNYYGSVAYYDPVTPAWSYPWTPFGQVFLDPVTYSDSRSDGASSVSGQWSSSTGAGQIGLTAVDNHAGPIETYAGLNVGNPFRFLGPFNTLPDFSYHYQFAGSKDSIFDSFNYNVQLELGYIYYDQDGKYKEQKFYSDYGDYGYGFRTNWVFTDSTTGQALMSIAESGDKTFSGFQTLDGEPHQWFIEYGFGINGAARSLTESSNGAGDAVVPEPASLSLLALGLSGLLLRKRKR